MSEWKAKRFWKQASVAETGSGYRVELDGRPVHTPGKVPLVLPTRRLAQALAAEWDAQEGYIDPRAMPFTRAANSAIERVAPQHAAVVAMLSEYGDADVTCYRAAAPEELVRRQSQVWDPLLDWAHRTHGARLIAVSGVMHQAQNPAALRRLTEPMNTMSAFQLTGFHDMVALSGSLVIALAAAKETFAPEDLWSWSRIDEDWQREQWGVDAEADRAADAKRQGFISAHQFYLLSSE